MLLHFKSKGHFDFVVLQGGGPGVVVSTLLLRVPPRRFEGHENSSFTSTRKTQYCMEPP